MSCGTTCGIAIGNVEYEDLHVNQVGCHKSFLDTVCMKPVGLWPLGSCASQVVTQEDEESFLIGDYGLGGEFND